MQLLRRKTKFTFGFARIEVVRRSRQIGEDKVCDREINLIQFDSKPQPWESKYILSNRWVCKL